MVLLVQVRPQALPARPRLHLYYHVYLWFDKCCWRYAGGGGGSQARLQPSTTRRYPFLLSSIRRTYRQVAPQASAIKLKTPTELVYLPSTLELSMPASVSMKTEVLLMSVLETRKPLLLLRLPAVFLLRLAERRLFGLLFQEPPRKTRCQ